MTTQPAGRDASHDDARAACIAATIRADVRALTRYPVANAEGWIKLDAMENPYAMPDVVRDALSAALAAVPINRYPDADAHGCRLALRASLGLDERFGIMLGNGSDELIQILTTAVAAPGAVVLAPEPSFVMYRRNAIAAHARFVGVPLRADFTLDVEAMLRAIERERPALVWLAYPNNPTGNLFDVADVERIVRAAPGLVAIDEAYYAFADAVVPAARARVPERRRRAHRVEDRHGRSATRLRDRPSGLDRRAREDASALQRQRLTQAAIPVLLAHADVFAQQALAIRRERDRVDRALAALPGVARLRDADELRAGARP